MARKDSEQQKKSMSLLFRGKAIFKPLNTGRIDERVACVREWVANIFFYTKNGVTIMIDAGYNYGRLQEKMGWLDMDPKTIRHILITHQDTDHVGALETDSEQLFRDATVYIGEIENRYLTGEVRRRVIHGLYKLPLVKTNNERVLLQDGQVLDIDGIKRRTRAGMGRCQAGFCTPRTVEILAEELGISPLEVTKFGGGSRLLEGYLFEEGKNHA